jgi:hypothetical protein
MADHEVDRQPRDLAMEETAYRRAPAEQHFTAEQLTRIGVGEALSRASSSSATASPRDASPLQTSVRARSR